MRFLARTPDGIPASVTPQKVCLAAAVIVIGLCGWGCAPAKDTLRERHARVVSAAEALRLPISMNQEELEALEQIGPLLDSVKVEMGGLNDLTGKIQIIFRGLELLRSDTLHTKPGMEAFRGTWDAINSSWGGAARMLPTDAAVALAAVETSFRTANSSLSSATGLWQLVNPKPPAVGQQQFDKPVNYWQRIYNDCYDKLDRVENIELRKQTAGMLAHWLNNAHNVDRTASAAELQPIKIPLILAQYLNGPSILNNKTEHAINLVAKAGAVGKNPPPRIYVARFAVYLAIVRAYNEHSQREGLGIARSNTPLERRAFFQESVRKHLLWILSTPNFGIELHHPYDS
ncbi:MAG TPA: hypothetical protein PKC13_21205, partial [Blastocatellia bacterium]|nr:hypothetical protein [Blastocatellia bacterium]HMV82333.1 hypothetical protein [Blastocatellia bacterium]HMX28120.1 hypothetical protein [Blastocatellia bacterium]HMY75238.1 hypothetical protein [Blastocatellia bacterium]HNG30713.1 hypothetical protein [Blastocatellia bacterium]